MDEMDVAERMREAASIMKLMPRWQLMDIKASWPNFIHEMMDAYGWTPAELKFDPPTGEAIDRMDEAMRWLLWLDVRDRKIVWLRATGVSWVSMAKRYACHRATMHRKWAAAIAKIISELEKNAVGEK